MLNKKENNKYLLLIDGSSLLSTQFFGNLPREIIFAKTTEEKEKYFYKIMQTAKGVYTNAIYGFMRSLLKIIKEQKPSYLAVAWDISRDTFRRKLYPDYKGNRGETLSPLKEQFTLCQKVLERIGVKQFMDERYEADDFCGTLSKLFEEKVPVKILTKDNDYLQLVSERTNLWMIHATAKKTEELYKKYNMIEDGSCAERSFNFTPELVRKEFGIEPESVNSLKGLQGDSSDNIKGVPGIGETTAVALISYYKNIDKLYEELDGLNESELKKLAGEWKKTLGINRSPISFLCKESETELVGKKAAFLSKELATIKRDIDMNGLLLEELKVAIDCDETQRVFDELEIKSIKLDIKESKADVLNEAGFKLITDMCQAEEVFNQIIDKGYGTVGISLQGDVDEVVGLSVTFESDKTVFIKTEGFITVDFLNNQIMRLKKNGITIAVIDLKRQLKAFDIEESDSVFDEAVAAYLLNPLDSEYSYDRLAKTFLDIRLKTREELIGKLGLEEAFSIIRDEALKAGCYESAVSLNCYEKIRLKLDEEGMTKLFYEIEQPLIFTLDEMEKCGVRVNRAALKEYGDNLAEGIKRLEDEVYQMAGEKFNISSPKQLGVILFEKLKLPYGKKTKTGYSTSADVLEKLKIEDPIIEKILEYRQLTKLKSTYADGMADYIGEDERIHTKLNQTVTATGRLSSTEPNLQNIPIRMELGRLIRKVFIPREGYIFLDADYSQIELRILADMSGDEKLINAYRNALDIHRSTASEVFHTPLNEVTNAQRSNAKAVNFGIVYGISSFGLGQGLNISKREAESYIERYFATYPSVKEYLDRLVAEAKDKGYSITMFGRRRPIPELDSQNFMQRSFGERIAMNSPIQGTAADIIKIAMLRVNRRLKKEKLTSRLILQIHDELLIETNPEESDIVRAILEEEMRGAAKLKVNLEVEVKQGNNWLEAH